MATILIPVHNSEEVVEVDVNELPEDENEIIDILQGELAPLDLWLRFAVEYYRQGKLDKFTKVLEPLTELHEPLRLNDNLTIPVFSSIAMQLAFQRIATC